MSFIKELMLCVWLVALLMAAGLLLQITFALIVSFL